MTDTYIIPNEPMAYPQGTKPDTGVKKLLYYPKKHEPILVTNWVRYPSYDFIFGVPREDNPRYAKEIGFFIYRDFRNRDKWRGLYLDVTELEEMLIGLQSIASKSVTINPKAWQKPRTQ